MKKTYETEKHYAPAYKASHYSELVDFLSEQDSKLTAERNTINKYANVGLLDGDCADKCVAHIDARRDEIRGMIKACKAAVSACIPAKGVFAKHHRDYLTGAEVNAINKAEELFNC
jgi:hypothetical protein